MLQVHDYTADFTSIFHTSDSLYEGGYNCACVGLAFSVPHAEAKKTFTRTHTHTSLTCCAHAYTLYIFQNHIFKKEKKKQVLFVPEPSIPDFFTSGHACANGKSAETPKLGRLCR